MALSFFQKLPYTPSLSDPWLKFPIEPFLPDSGRPYAKKRKGKNLYSMARNCQSHRQLWGSISRGLRTSEVQPCLSLLAGHWHIHLCPSRMVKRSQEESEIPSTEAGVWTPHFSAYELRLLHSSVVVVWPDEDAGNTGVSEGSLRERCWRSPVAATLLQSLRIIKCSASHTASAPPAANRWQASFGERSPEGHAGLMLQLAETKTDFRCAGGPEPPGVGTALGEMHRAAKEPGPSLYPHGVPASGTRCQPPPGLGTTNGV